QKQRTTTEGPYLAGDFFRSIGQAQVVDGNVGACFGQDQCRGAANAGGSAGYKSCLADERRHRIGPFVTGKHGKPAPSSILWRGFMAEIQTLAMAPEGFADRREGQAADGTASKAHRLPRLHSGRPKISFKMTADRIFCGVCCRFVRFAKPADWAWM